MDYFPNGKNIKVENELLNGLKRLKSLGKKETNQEKEVTKDSLNKIELNLQNFISKTLEKNSKETKYFNINQELEEIEKTQKNKIKEEESFAKLKTKIPFGEQFFSVNIDENINNANNLIGLNHFKHKKKKFSHNNLIGINNIYHKNSQISNISTPAKHTKNSFDFSNNNIDNIIQLKLKQKNSIHKNNTSNSSNILDSSTPKQKNKTSIQISLKNDFFPFIDKDLKSKKSKLIKHSSASKINFPVKKQFFDNIQKYKLIPKKEKNKLTKIYRRNREKSQVINKAKVFLRLMEKDKNFQNEKKRIFNSTLSKDLEYNFNKTKTFIPNYNFSEDLLLSENTIDENDIRNIINLTSNEYNEFSKYCDSIKESLLSSPNKTSIKQIKTLPSLKKIENIINEQNNFKNNKTINEMTEKKKSNLLPLLEKKKFLEEEEINLSDIMQKNMDIKEFKEFQYRHLIKLDKLVYDSLSDEESDIEFDDTFYIDPKSKFKLYFDLIIFVFSWYNLIIPPIKICFFPKKDNYYYSKTFIVNIIINLFYIIDLFLGFFTAYYDIEERFIRKISDIILNYLTKWFIIDLICSFPYFIISLKSITKIEKQISINEFKIIYLIELIPLIKIFKIYKQNFFFFKYRKFLSKQTSLVKIFQASNFILIFIICGHILACIFIFLSHLENPSWVSVQHLSDSPKFEIYISSFYYVFTTVFTVGYGDIVSINTYERFFNLILLIFGIMVYSFSVSSLSNYVQNVDFKTQDYNKKMEILQHLKLTHEKLSPILYEKISRFLKYRLTHISKDKNEIMDNLPIGLKTRLIMEMYKPIINNFIFFKTYNSSDFIIRVILAFRPIITMKNERLVNEGDYIEEIIFVKRGTLSLELPLPILINDKDIDDINTKYRRASLLNMEFPHSSIKNNKKKNGLDKPKIIDFNNDIFNKKTVTFIRGKGLSFNDNKNEHFIIPIQQYVKIIEIRKNEHFGDILMFLNRRSPLSMKVKSKVAELFLLNKTDAVEISMNFPKIWGLIIKKSLFNMEQIERLINKALKFFFNQNEGKKPKRISYSQYYQKDFTKKNIFVNCNEIYSSLSSEDCELQSIPSVTEVNDNSNKNTMLIHSEKDKNNFIKNKNSNNIDSDNKSNSSNKKKNILNEKDDKNSNLIKSNSSSSDSIINDNKENENINDDLSNIKIINNDTDENKEIFMNILNKNETIREENSDDEKDSIIQKRIKMKNSFETERKNIPTKKPTNGSNEYSDSDSNFFNSNSDSYKCKSKTETEKENLDNNYFDLSTFSSNNNSLLYPFVKEEINNEEYPFENNDISNFLRNNCFNKKFNGIVPKDFIIEKYLRSKLLIKSKDDSQKEKLNINDNYSSNNINNSHLKEKEFIFSNLSTSSFSFQIKSLGKENVEILLIPSPKEKVELFIIKNESFTLNPKIKKRITSISESNLPIFKKTFTSSKLKNEINNNNKDDVIRAKTDKLNFQRKNIVHKTVKVKSDRRMSKIILNPRTSHFLDSGRKQLYGNDEKKNMPLFSEDTLDLIGQNIKSTSLALNNPKMFYTNYFNKFVEADTNEKKTFSYKLKEIEKIIQNGKNSKRQVSSFDMEENNSNNNNNINEKKSK